MVSDMDLRKMYPNVNRFEDNAKKASWSVVTLNSPNDIIFNFLDHGDTYQIRITKIKEK